MALPPGSLARGRGPASTAVRISCAVMAHPRREADALELVAALREFDPVVVLDPEPDGPPSTLRTAAAAWSAVPDWATHHLVLQDDAAPCADFAGTLDGILARHGDLPLSLFTEWGSGTATMVRWAALAGRGLVRCVDQYVPTVGLVLPAPLARGLGDFARTWPDRELPDDIAVAHYLEARGATPHVTAPNLVQHDGDLSLVGNTGAMGVRRSPWLRRTGDPSAEGGILPAPPLVPLISWPKARAVAVRWDVATQSHAGYTALRGELERAGIPHTATAAALDEWLASAVGERLEAALGYGFLHETWSVAVALGVFIPVPLAEDAHRDIGRRALETLAPGGLRTLAPNTVTDPALRADLAALTQDGFTFGYARHP